MKIKQESIPSFLAKYGVKTNSNSSDRHYDYISLEGIHVSVDLNIETLEVDFLGNNCQEQTEIKRIYKVVPFDDMFNKLEEVDKSIKFTE